MPKNYMGVDQYSDTYHDLGPYPRKELLARLDRKRCDKQYIDDTKTGETIHTGYVVAGLWITLFEVKPMRRAA
jgi:hypothetical protein